MIPLKDTIPSKTYPFVNFLLIGANFSFFFIELMQGPSLNNFIQQYGIIPSHLKLSYNPDMGFVDFVYFKYFPFVSSLFLHGGWFHLLGNMLFLWIFGDNVEDRLGHFRYLVFYLLSGIAASIGHILVNPDSTIPTIGASGAIAGVLGAYVLLYPLARVKTLIFIFIIIDIIELPAVIFIFLWFGMQLFNGLGSIMASQDDGGVAWFAHIGGFVAGIVLVNIFKKRKKEKRPPRFYRYEMYPWK